MKRYLFTALVASLTLATSAIGMTPRMALKRSQQGLEKMPATMSATAIVNDETSLDSLRQLGAIVNARIGNVVTLQLPASAVEASTQLRGVRNLATARHLTLCNDTVRTLVGANDAHNGTGFDQRYTGSGVYVAVIDCGIDIHHINFKDSAGNSRVKAVYYPTDTTGTAPVIDGDALPGSCYETTEEIAALTCNDTTYSHGSHTLGTAAGSYRGNGYHGIAPDADLIVCDIPASELTDANVINSITYILDYVTRNPQPCVVNISLGSTSDAHNGTSIICQAFDAFSGPGRIISLSAGNDGNRRMCVDYQPTTDTDTLNLLFSSYSYTPEIKKGYAEFWSTDATPQAVQFIVANSSNGEIVYSTPMISDLPEDSTYILSSETDSVLAKYLTTEVQLEQGVRANGQYATAFEAKVTPIDNYVLGLRMLAASGSHVRGWGVDNIYFYNYKNSAFRLGDNAMTISDLATGDSTISVGNYYSRNVVPLSDGDTYTYSGYTLGDIVRASSFGPDARGIARPTVTGPGAAVVSSLNRYDVTPKTRFDLPFEVDGDTYYYGPKGGTSMSTPVVTGAIALWLQAIPSLGPAQVMQVIQETALRDDYVTNGDLNRWGAGKIDIVAGLNYINNSAITEIAVAQGDKQAIATEYYDAAGHRLAQPSEGFNIVVTRYSDGSRQASKRVIQ